jgi:hypothetical protein
MLSVSSSPVVMDSRLAGKSPRPGMTSQEFCRLVLPTPACHRPPRLPGDFL